MCLGFAGEAEDLNIVDKAAFSLHTRFKHKAAKYLALAKEGKRGAYEQARAFQIQSNKWLMTAIGLGDPKPVVAPKPKPKRQRLARSNVPTRRSLRNISNSHNSDDSDESDGSFHTVKSADYSDKEFESFESPVVTQNHLSEEPVFDVEEPSTWLPLWHPCKLPNKVLCKDFLKVLEELGHDHTMFPPEYYRFVLRVCNVYHSHNKDNKLDLNRFFQCKDAAIQVLPVLLFIAPVRLFTVAPV